VGIEPTPSGSTLTIYRCTSIYQLRSGVGWVKLNHLKIEIILESLCTITNYGKNKNKKVGKCKICRIL
jgi:hypothetical protein